MSGPTDRDLLRSVRVISSIVILCLIAFIVLADRLLPIFTEQYEALGDTALGLLIGALCALGGVQGLDFLRGK